MFVKLPLFYSIAGGTFGRSLVAPTQRISSRNRD
jgi:hypothetical protein